MDNCIDKLLLNYNQDNIERHSDSSDFDETQIVPRVSPKGGKHCLLDETVHTTNREISQVTFKDSINKQRMHPTLTIDDNIPVRDHNVNTKHKIKKVPRGEFSRLNNRGGDAPEQQTRSNSKEAQHKPIPHFTNILEQPNYTKQISTIRDIPQDSLNNGKNVCPDCERRRIKKLNRRRQTFIVQPVYAVGNIQGTNAYGGPVPFGHANDRAPLPQHMHKVKRKQDSNTSYELTSSESDVGNKNQQKHISQPQNFIDRFKREMRKEYIKYEKELIRNRIQQYPSKRDYNLINQVLSNPFCEIMNADTVKEGDQSNIPSTSSGFWEYLFEKIRGKRQPEPCGMSKPCYCNGNAIGGSPPQQQANYDGKPQDNTYTNVNNHIPECNSCMQQTDDGNIGVIKNLSSKSDTQNGKKGIEKIKCKCYTRTKLKPDAKKNFQKLLPQGDDVYRPCQEPHDDITRTVEEKYNGEILCIHNPPCILINGCLNLPTSERPHIQGNLWPVMQDKKTSFYHICRKIKRSKNNCEQGCQYHPPSIEVQRAMQIKTEKLVQSICNHDPPCQVVYGCYKAKYDPKLDNSCVHVPMCQQRPKCLIDHPDTNRHDAKQDKLCEHKPKCTEVPLCSRKFVELTAKGTVGTQVRPKSKLVCRHEPPCIMIPKCLARIISDSYVPYEAIPDCVHQPCCDMIPACCRRAAKEMVSVSSQYPNAPCRIV